MQHNILPLSTLADVHTIQLFRDKTPELDSDGEAFAISIRDLVGTWPLAADALPRIHLGAEHASSCLKNNDIVMPARGDRYPARFFHVQDEMIIPVGQISVISVYREVLPLYLTWYLNTKKMQQTIASVLTGTNIKSLNKSKLLALDIVVPPAHIQESISNLQFMHEQRLALQNELISLEKMELEAVCTNLLRRGD